uniref:Uncharacterized protein n=1 Tax=Anguilla anguilla TaxID=7936 RepID=A0A0E9WET6_ANGAN
MRVEICLDVAESPSSWISLKLSTSVLQLRADWAANLMRHKEIHFLPEKDYGISK